MNGLTENAQKTLNFLIQYQDKHGFSPSIAEIKNAIGTKSTRGAILQLEKLDKLGYIKRNPHFRRAITILIRPEIKVKETVHTPILGEVKAGYGGIIDDNVEGYKDVPLSLTHGRKDIVLVRIRGESMIRAGYFPGDLAIVIPQSVANDNDIVIVYDEEEETETIKRFKKLKSYAILLPETNDPDIKPKIGTHFRIQGKVIGKVS